MYMCFNCKKFCGSYCIDKCKDFIPTEIDDMCLPYIKEFNRKGYLTQYCCSGHTDENILTAYVSFKPGPAAYIIPMSFSAMEYASDEIKLSLHTVTVDNNGDIICRNNIISEDDIAKLTGCDIVAASIYPSDEVMEEYEKCETDEDRWIIISRANARFYQLAISLPTINILK